MDQKFMGVMLVMASIFIMVFAQLLFKHRLSVHGVIPLNVFDFWPYFLKLAADWRVWIGGFGLILSALFWYAAVSRVPLSYAFPFAALSYPVIMIASTLFLQESITAPKIIANALIVSGVLVLGLSNTA